MNLPTTNDIKEMKSVSNIEEADVLVFLTQRRLENTFKYFKENPAANNFNLLEDCMFAYQQAVIIRKDTK